jgi:Lrp/AsnC family leucine-responsive transcriptional regulator
MSERVKKLEEGGVIVGYTAKVNLKAIGLGLQAIIRIRTTHEHIAYYVERFQSMPEVLDAVRVTGEDCFVVQCAFADPSDLERVVDTLATHASVSTALVLSHPVTKAAYAEG